jgi:hypothetical protein
VEQSGATGLVYIVGVVPKRERRNCAKSIRNVGKAEKTTKSTPVSRKKKAKVSKDGNLPFSHVCMQCRCFVPLFIPSYSGFPVT